MKQGKSSPNSGYVSNCNLSAGCTLTSCSGWRGLAVLLFSLVFSTCLHAQDPASGQPVSALGRLEPEHGITTIGVPSTPYAVSGSILAQLHVSEGDEISQGQLLATTDTVPVLEARVAEAEAKLVFARREVEAANSNAEEACVRADVAQQEAERRTRLHDQGVAGEEEAESARGEAKAQLAACKSARTAVHASEANVRVMLAHVNLAKAELNRAFIYAPQDGRVLDIKARPGEHVGLGGIMDIGDVRRMMAIAEVYETDISRVRTGQSATISSAALQHDLSGTVQFIRQLVAKQDEIGTDPAARKDARIIEVEILLDDPQSAASLTNLQVDVVIHP